MGRLGSLTISLITSPPREPTGRAAIQERSDAERHVLEAIRAARVAGMPWSAIGLFVWHLGGRGPAALTATKSGEAASQLLWLTQV